MRLEKFWFLRLGRLPCVHDSRRNESVTERFCDTTGFLPMVPGSNGDFVVSPNDI